MTEVVKMSTMSDSETVGDNLTTPESGNIGTWDIVVIVGYFLAVLVVSFLFIFDNDMHDQRKLGRCST